MPLKLFPPHPGRSPHWRIRGTYLGVRIDESARTGRKPVAAALLRKREAEIERGAIAGPKAPTFAGAAAAYMIAGGERRFLTPLIRHFAMTKLPAIDQAMVDAAAAQLYPDASLATRNRQVYSPVSAILKRAGISLTLKRPKGSQGRALTHWLKPEEAFRLFAAADRIDREFGLLLRFLCYTGVRLSEALRLECRAVELEQRLAYIARTKNEEPRGVALPPNLVEALRRHPRKLDREGRLFKFTKSGDLYLMLSRAAARAEVTLPERVAFHVFCHTWATWMRRAGADLRGLVGTDRWKDQKSVARYAHVVVSEESRRADLLPVEAGAITVRARKK